MNKGGCYLFAALRRHWRGLTQNLAIEYLSSVPCLENTALTNFIACSFAETFYQRVSPLVVVEQGDLRKDVFWQVVQLFASADRHQNMAGALFSTAISTNVEAMKTGSIDPPKGYKKSRGPDWCCARSEKLLAT